MDSKSISGDPENTAESAAKSSPGISRRSVVKAGAAAAWTVPLVQVVAAAPASAMTSGGPVLVVSQPTGSQSDSGDTRTATLNFTVTNTGNTSSGSVTVTVAFTQGWHKNGMPTSAWSQTGSSSHSKLFASLAPGAQQSIQLTFTGKKDGATRVGGPVTAEDAAVNDNKSFVL